ncbi:hypothetical protein FS749_011959 [Ceratobasidium sp. UAMH 11750]|nr:hypothetical protein FS749_011959 [Ceratobasidium sp. UAMH 11750]
MPPVLPPMPPTVHRHWAPDVAPYKYADDRDWDEYRPRQLPAEHHPKPAPKASRTTTKAPSNKRAPATDAVGPEPPKKRRKDESAPVPPVPMPTPTNSKRPDAHKPEERVPVQTDLSTLPVSSLVSYLVKHDIIPPIHPSPYTAQPALAPSILLNPPSHTPPPPPPPPSSISLIPERERRRSSRFQEDDPNGSTAGDDPTTHHVPILPDLDAVHGALAKLVERHWHTKTVREQDTIAGFVWSAQRARERTLLAASSAGHG